VIQVPAYLVVANQTLPGAELRAEIDKRIQAGSSSFHVLVPNTHPRDLAGDFAQGWGGGRVEGSPAVRRTQADEATAIAQSRLGQLLGDLRRMGAEADGELGDADPLKAVAEVLRRRQVDEILLSTLPQHVSRWLGMDLPHRLHRRFGLPVTTITTKR
jgi:hypothetical protein